MQYGFIKTRTLQAETSKGWFVWVSLYRDNKEMKKSLKPFSFKTILTKDAYSSLKNTVFGVIASKLATVCRKMLFLSDNISGRQDNCQHFHLCCGNICRGFIGIWILRKKQDVGQWRIGLNNLKIVVRIWNVTVGGIVCSSRISHRRNGTFIRTESSKRLSLFDSLDILSTSMTFYAVSNDHGTPPNTWSTTRVYRLCLKVWLHESSTIIGWYLVSCDLCTRVVMVDKVSVFICTPPTAAWLNYLTGLLSSSLCTCTVLWSIYCQNPVAWTGSNFVANFTRLSLFVDVPFSLLLHYLIGCYPSGFTTVPLFCLSFFLL